MIFPNGFPKHGNHALVKALQLLGQPCDTNHLQFDEAKHIPSEAKHVFIKRDPRDGLLSWMRFTGKEMTPGMFITSFRAMDDCGSLVSRLAKFEQWLSDPSVLVIRYEDLIASDECMRNIAAWAKIGYIEGAWEALPGLTRTWYPNHSDHKTFWTSDIEAVWVAEGGQELLNRWGY